MCIRDSEFSDRLYGRDAELRALLDALGRASRGAVETVLVSGYSGIGKSALVREIHGSVTSRRGYLVAGKFEQAAYDVYKGELVAALGGLIAQVLAEPVLD